MRILALSATLPNIKEFIGWLKKVHPFPIKEIIEEHRPVPLHFFFHCDDEVFTSFSELKQSKLLRKSLRQPSYTEKYFFSKPNRLKTLLKDVSDRGAYPCVYFSFSRRRCEELAQEVGYFDFLNTQEKERITKLFDELLFKFNISSSPHISFLAPLIKKGIAHAL